MAELQYLADHLSAEECRRLVAAAHYQNVEEPNALDQAERKLPKDIPCLEHLYHWNGQIGEGKGQTHEILENRLRQMDRTDLADWLGKTVFHQLGVDLADSIKQDLDNLTSSDEGLHLPIITLEPLKPKIENPTKYNTFDYVLYSMVIGLILTIFGVCFKILYDNLKEKLRKKRRPKKYQSFVDTDTSGSDNEEDKFDVRAIRVN